MPLIKTSKLKLAYKGHVVLSDVSFEIKQGEIVTVVGPNGSGKTTFLRALIGAISPLEGKIEHAPDLRIGYVPQSLKLDATMPISVDRFIALQGLSQAADRVAALEKLGISNLANTDMSELSGGQRQRVLIARALLNNPQLLILDEPTQGLDQPAAAALYQLIQDLRANLNCAVLMVSHDLHVVMAASERVICLNGHICCEGTPQAVMEAPAYRALFGTGTQGQFALYRHDHTHHHHDH